MLSTTWLPTETIWSMNRSKSRPITPEFKHSETSGSDLVFRNDKSNIHLHFIKNSSSTLSPQGSFAIKKHINYIKTLAKSSFSPILLSYMAWIYCSSTEYWHYFTNMLTLTSLFALSLIEYVINPSNLLSLFWFRPKNGGRLIYWRCLCPREIFIGVLFNIRPCISMNELISARSNAFVITPWSRRVMGSKKLMIWLSIAKTICKNLKFGSVVSKSKGISAN